MFLFQSWVTKVRYNHFERRKKQVWHQIVDSRGSNDSLNFRDFGFEMMLRTKDVFAHYKIEITLYKRSDQKGYVCETDNG